MAPDAVKRLSDYVRAGGDLVTDARHARALPASLTGVQFGPEAQGCLSHVLSCGETFQEQPYDYTVLSPAGARVLAINEQGHPLITVHKAGQGRVIVGAPDYWMTDGLTYAVPEIVNMEPPCQLLDGVRSVLGGYFDSFNPIRIDPAGLNVHTCCYDGDPKRLLVGLINNDLFASWRGSVRVRPGEVISAKELWKGRRLKVGDRIELEIPAGDVAILDIRCAGPASFGLSRAGPGSRNDGNPGIAHK
jgi:hypothetical protein